ncbi:MAG: hypothetical protein GX982_04170 [Tissierellia bacterium]|nr:hypothetical protein [Tissierellia bacterium]
MTENYDNLNLPSIDELIENYNDEIRYKVDIKEDNLNNEGLFFNTFRKKEKEYKEKSLEKNIYYEKYRAFVENEKAIKEKEIEDIENKIAYEKFFLNWERKVNKKITKKSHYGSTPQTRYRVDRISELEDKLEKLINSSREAWEVYYRKILLEDIENHHNGRLVDVDYVKKSKEKIHNALDMGLPVYIVGHLGSGKTQLATEVAVEFTVENRIQDYLEMEMENWFRRNPTKDEDEALKEFNKLNSHIRNYYKDILNNGSKEEVEKLQPLFISGSHNLTYEDMFVEKTLVLKSSFSKDSYGKYLNQLTKDFYEWMDEHRENLEKATEEEQLQLKIQIWKSLSDLLVAKNSAFGTEIAKTEKEILRAIREGRPVIVDELNAIAMQNLIALNDILQKHIGSSAYITGVGRVYIKPGFAFIGTGNLSTRLVNYEGTNELNPAFKSRFVSLEYNYVNQNTVGSLEDQENLSKNELFRIIITKLLDKNGNLSLPNPKTTLDELFRFAQLSRITQEVFMGKWRDDNKDFNSSFDNLELKESVLSIRNILHVLDDWNLGEEKDFTKALWDGFISSITYPDDQSYILSQAVRFGFFSKSEGWDVKTKAIGESTTSYDEIRKNKYIYNRADIRHLSYLDILYLIYGKGVERKKYPKGFLDKLDDIDKDKIDIETYEKLDKDLRKLENSEGLIDFLENDGE